MKVFFAQTYEVIMFGSKILFKKRTFSYIEKFYIKFVGKIFMLLWELYENNINEFDILNYLKVKRNNYITMAQSPAKNVRPCGKRAKNCSLYV